MTDFFGGMELFRLADGVRLRREHFGGIIFDPATGNTVEVDREAFAMLMLIQENGTVAQAKLNHLSGFDGGHSGNTAVAKIIRQLQGLGIVESKPGNNPDLIEGDAAILHHPPAYRPD